jgi:hypothetical protein
MTTHRSLQAHQAATTNRADNDLSRNDNKYPGCCCDVPSILYSYSFATNPDWSRAYPGQEEILEYLTQVAQSYGLYKHVRFSSTVEDATWDDATQQWHVRVKRAGGTKEAESTPSYILKTDFLVSAVGQLNTPKYPEIPGLNENFEGKVIHSARWDWSYDLAGKKIALLGNGESSEFFPCLVQESTNSHLSQAALPFKFYPRLPKSPNTSQSSNAHRIGLSPDQMRPSRPWYEVYTNMFQVRFPSRVACGWSFASTCTT